MTLISRLEQAEAGSSDLDEQIADHVLKNKQRFCIKGLSDEAGGNWFYEYPDGSVGTALRFTRSIDAAMSLVPEGWMLSGLAETIDGKATSQIEKRFTLFQRKTFENGGQVVVDSERAEAATPALALCIASLKAAGYE